MLGDDPDPLVTTIHVWFGEVFGRALQGAASWQGRLGGHGQEGSKNPIGLEWSGRARRSEGR